MEHIPFAGCFATNKEPLHKDQLVFIGLPDDRKSSYLRGAAQGPQSIRKEFNGNCYNSTTETGIDLAGKVIDYGDLPPKASWQETYDTYAASLQAVIQAGAIPFCAGGDHAVTIPLLTAFSIFPSPIHVIQIDAHPDLYMDYEEDSHSHACTGARILEMDHVRSLTQIGIRAMNEEQREFSQRFPDKYRVYEARNLVHDLPSLDFIPSGEPVYISIDLDGFDPAYAPGVSHLMPGGLTPRQVINFIQKGHWKLVGMDVVEVNPSRDLNGQTAVLAGKLLLEGMGYAFHRVQAMESRKS